MTRRAWLTLGLTLAACGLAACATTSKEVRLKLALDVTSQPEKAQVQYHGKVVGSTPVSIEVNTYGDLQSVVASLGDLSVVEKRLRILSPEKAQLIFKFNKQQQSLLARTLGVQSVLIFDYSENVSFDIDKFDLKPQALPVLNTQADILNTYFPNASVYVCGHTDSTGTDDHNLKLSLKRAQAVADYLAARGVGKNRLQVRGFGKDDPVESNATPSGRALNRRTEVVLPQ
jgi:outer membrane protein OmpA-like peptidoglycan-associated protein